MSKSTSIIICLLFVICALLAVIIFRKPQVTDYNEQEKILKDSLVVLQNQINSSHVRQNKLEKAYDSLSSLEPTIIYKTRDKIKFIYSDATPNELDSIIRASWKAKPGFR